ncbi:hypothetical protein scyTo_0004919 [Scyliorhinus torazame]|uniref:VPS9 domain-containing protein n=1 Tax=Scyliorhinus torazame TaxID=75743 RepID=A0A401NZ77_SCYTO|nr:hypothetical protein [Scyliorhinus torazame]
MMERASGQEVETGDMPGPLLGVNDECGPPLPAPVPSLPLPLPGISILDKLIRTCPVWLQLNSREEKVTEILHSEPPGRFMVRKDCTLSNMVLSVNFPGFDGVPHVQDYPIKEDKSIMYLDGSLLVFEDIFKMVAFYCVSRDILPSTLILPQAIADATNSDELQVVSHLGIDFWNSHINKRYQEGTFSVLKDLNVVNNQTRNLQTAPRLSTDKKQCSCEIEFTAGNDKLWFVNPVFIKEYCSAAPSVKQNSNSPNNMDLKVRRPPPLPPRPKPSELIAALSSSCRGGGVQFLRGGEFKKNGEDINIRRDHENLIDLSDGRKETEIDADNIGTQNRDRFPPVPPRRRPSEKQLIDINSSQTEGARKEAETVAQSNETWKEKPPIEVFIEPVVNEQQGLLSEKAEDIEGDLDNCTSDRSSPEQRKQTCHSTPVAPPRRKKKSYQIAEEEIKQEHPVTGQQNKASKITDRLGTIKDQSEDASDSLVESEGVQSRNLADLKIADGSLYSPDGSVLAPGSEVDSFSTSSTEEEQDPVNAHLRPKKHRHTMMLDKAKNRLSIVALSNVLNAFRSTDRKILKKITELAQEKASYFGHLVQDYKAYTLEVMGKHTSSTEMLQEIRQMMTQLKSYLLQSTELTSMVDSSYQSEEKLEAVVEAALSKSHGADDFLPVLMYVLARSDLTSLLLDVEYMMELLDPSLHLGEGYYYLTTTYGALEHIKHYDKHTVTRQLSHEVQDSIHQWQRRRTLNVKQVSRSSMQVSITMEKL